MPAVATNSASANAPISPAAERFELKIEALKKTNVTVVVDNDVAFDGKMKAGENQSFSATDHFQVSADNAGALHLELNGKALAPIGPSGQEGKVTLTGSFNPDYLVAPVGKGQQVGALVLMVDGKPQSTVPMLATASVARGGLLKRMVDRLRMRL